MNWIACSSDCIYQKEGECHLERALSPGESGDEGCVYFVPRVRPDHGTEKKETD